jgi:hypothetical protein
VGKVSDLTSSLTDFALYFSLAWLAVSLLSPLSLYSLQNI